MRNDCSPYLCGAFEHAGLNQGRRRVEAVHQAGRDQDGGAALFGRLIDDVHGAQLKRGRITFANRAATKIFDWSLDELLGQPFTIFLPERFRAGWQQRLEHFLSTGEATLLGRTIEVLGARKGGEEFPMEASLGWWEAGDRRAFTGIMRDVAERNATLLALELSHARYHAVVDMSRIESMRWLIRKR